MNILFTTVKNYDTRGNVFLDTHFEFNPNKHYKLITPNHELDLTPTHEIKNLRDGEPYFRYSKNQLTVCIKNGNASKMLLLWKGRRVKVIELR